MSAPYGAGQRLTALKQRWGTQISSQTKRLTGHFVFLHDSLVALKEEQGPRAKRIKIRERGSDAFIFSMDKLSAGSTKAQGTLKKVHKCAHQKIDTKRQKHAEKNSTGS